MLKPPEFKESRETQIVYDLMRQAIHRDPPLLTWDEICEATGKSRSKLYGAIHTSMKRLRRSDRVVVENDRNIGYRLRHENELSQCGQSAIERTRRLQRTGIEKMDCADLAKLTNEERARHITRKTVLELGLASTRPRTISNIDQMVIRRNNELTGDEMVKAIREALMPRK